jgi:levanase/fructan beta-fructosidase
MKKFLLLAIGVFFLIGCKEKTEANRTIGTDTLVISEETRYRPNFHFTPKANWMNDPNGMFYFDGTYHLYFQYYPDGNVWGPMHWGHAISKDLIIWEEQPIAIYPDSLGYIFSGSAVVDVNNTSGFAENGKKPIVAMYTYHNMDGEKAERMDFQTQAIAYSFDEGQTFIKYDKNPVIKNPGIKDFRDPKVVWDNDSKQWIMVLAAGQKIMFYSSSNLKDWKLLLDFGDGIGSHDGVWECPDLFKLKVEGTDEEKWVLLVSINPGGPNGGSATQYFVGDFNGKSFTVDTFFEQHMKSKKAIWLDYGRDNYAGVTWSNIPKEDGRKLFIGWMSNWDYAREVPTETWRSAMTIPRELKLKKVNNNYQLVSQPVKELEAYKKIRIEKANIKFDEEFIVVNNKDIDVNNTVIEIELSNLKNDTYTFSLSNSQGDHLEFGMNNIEHYYFVDRIKSCSINFSDKFADKVSKAYFETPQEKISIQMIIDKTSIELFYNYGETVMTEIFFPNSPMETLKLVTLNQSETTIDKLIVSELELKN